MGKRLYVGNIPFRTTEDQLRSLFEQQGAQVDRETGRPRGFAFVEMSSDEQAVGAIETLHGKEFGGRPLTVSEARERQAR